MPVKDLRRRRQKLAPAWQIVLLSDEGDLDITSRLSERLISLRITDKDGIEADELEVVLDDADGDLNIPPTGALLSVRIGWQGESLVGKGQFTVDDLEYSGNPDRLTIRGKGAPVSGSLNQKKGRSWHEISFGEMVETIAKEHGMTPAIPADLAAITFSHVDQTEESDLNFLTRMARDNGAAFSMKEDRLVMIRDGGAQTVSGKGMPTFTFDRTECQPNYSWATSDRTKYTGVEAEWHDPDAAERRSYLAGTDAQVKVLRKVYSDEPSAQRAAVSELDRLLRGAARLTVTLAAGDPTIGPECNLTVTGFKMAISGTPWLVKEVTHTITKSGGFTTALQNETKPA